MRAIVINPVARTVERVLDEFQDPKILMFHIQSVTLTHFSLGPTHSMFVDEFGMFRKDQHWFGLKGIPVAVAGKGVILSRAGPDEFGPCQMEVERVAATIAWYDDPREAEALVPPSRIYDKPGGRLIKEAPADGFRTMDKEFVSRDGKVIPFDPTRLSSPIRG